MRNKHILGILTITVIFFSFLPVTNAAEIEDIPGETKEQRVERLFFYISRWSREYEELSGPAIWELRGMGVEAVEMLLPHLESEDVRERVMMENLINGFGVDCTPSLIDGLSFETALGRARSATYLGNVGDVRAVMPMFELLDIEDDWTVISSILSGLGKLAERDIDVASIPVVPFATHEIEPIRRAAVVALGRIGDVDTIPVLIHALDDELFTIRYPAASALAEYGDDAIDSLSELLDSGDSTRKSLGCYALGFSGSDLAYDLLESMLTSVEPIVRAHAAEGFKNLGDDGIRITLKRMKYTESDPAVLGEIEEALSIL